MHKTLVYLLFLLCFSTGVHGALPGADPAVETRVAGLSEQLRCLVCQNQSLAESNAPLANDLKLQVREKISQGLSDDEIVGYMVERYGDFVLYRPPVKTHTWLLWFGPALLLMLALAMMLRLLARQRLSTTAPTDEEMRRAALLLEGRDDAGGQR